MFLSPNLVAATNRHVHTSPPDRLPHFKRDFPGRVDVNGAILRYSTTGEEPCAKRITATATSIEA